MVGGLLDMAVDDERLRRSLHIAKEQGLEVTFRAVHLRDAHPNTVVVEAVGESGRRVRVQAASIGGGSIRVQYLDGLEVGFSGEKITLVIRHTDAPGAIAMVTRLLSEAGINIATMRVFRHEVGGKACMAIELDARPEPALLAALRALPGLKDVTLLDQL